MLLSSCDNLVFNEYQYYGDDISLRVASRESILGVIGYFTDESIVLEKDDDGRVLYGFLGSTTDSDYEVLAIGVVQKTDKTTVFYYDGLNMISVPYIRTRDEKLVVSTLYDSFEIESIEELKEANDWGKPFDSGKCFSTPITRTKPHPFKRSVFEPIFADLGDDYAYHDAVFVSTDQNGLYLYLIQVFNEDRAGIDYLVMINREGDLVSDSAILELTPEQIEDPWEIMYQFKITNGWAFH
jgi:hypothetical protein